MQVNLREYMDKHGLDVIDLAGMFDVSTYAIKKWLRGERIPRDKMKAKISKLTKGEVSGNDWIVAEGSLNVD
jgi:hypothetical protein